MVCPCGIKESASGLFVFATQTDKIYRGQRDQPFNDDVYQCYLPFLKDPRGSDTLLCILEVFEVDSSINTVLQPLLQPVTYDAHTVSELIIT
jgi:hypothetical protein